MRDPDKAELGKSYKYLLPVLKGGARVEVRSIHCLLGLASFVR